MIKKLLLMLLLIPSICYAGTVSRHTTYAVNSQVTFTNLNGNFDNILNEINTGLDNNNADTAGGYRFLETLGSLPSAGTQGRVAFLTTDNTLNFDTGSAWTRVITASGTPSQGDIIYYNGSAWSRLTTGTSGYFLQTLGVGANPQWAIATQYSDTRFKVVASTRDISITGTQAIIGAGFAPKGILIIGGISGAPDISIGVAESSLSGVVAQVSTGNSVIDTNIIYISPAGGGSVTVVVTSWDSDGVTLTWAKSGSPTGTFTFKVYCIR